MRTLFALTLVAGGPAFAQVDGLPPTTAFDARVKACAPASPALKAVARLPDGETIQGTFADGKKVLFTTVTGDACDTVYPVGTASARASGQFDAAGKVVKAFTVTQAGTCAASDMGGCAELLVLKDAAGAYVAASKMTWCQAPRLTATPLFSKTHQGIIVRCRTGKSDDLWKHSDALYGYTATGLKRMIDVQVGFDGDAKGMKAARKLPNGGANCRVQPPGLLKVVEFGEKPGLVVREADDDPANLSVMHTTRKWNGARFDVTNEPLSLEPDPEFVCP